MSACGKSGKAEEAAWIMTEMRRQGVTLNKISYSAAMFALGNAGRLEEVLVLVFTASKDAGRRMADHDNDDDGDDEENESRQV